MDSLVPSAPGWVGQAGHVPYWSPGGTRLGIFEEGKTHGVEAPTEFGRRMVSSGDAPDIDIGTEVSGADWGTGNPVAQVRNNEGQLAR